ncbi:acyl-CoA thioesterase [Desulfotalea psychrophila]|nr:acyl-CoA thioesterase [Desulfotalea psychrophila]
MNIEERKEKAQTSIFKTIFPSVCNHYNTMYGGTAMQLMDEVAFMTATRFSRKVMVTVSSEKINFSSPIPSGTFVELSGSIGRIGKTSLDVQVNIFVEEMYSDSRIEAITGTFTLVALDEERKPTLILDVA